MRFEPTLEIDNRDAPLPEVGFTEKNKHFFNLDLNATLPQYQGSEPHTTWDPETWLLKTTNNDPNQSLFLYFYYKL